MSVSQTEKIEIRRMPSQTGRRGWRYSWVYRRTNGVVLAASPRSYARREDCVRAAFKVFDLGPVPTESMPFDSAFGIGALFERGRLVWAMWTPHWTGRDHAIELVER